MLIQFTVGNYRSFKDPVTLSMVAANLKAKDKTLDENNTFAATPKLRLLKSAAIYGANASGKSNLVKALKFMREFVINSARESQAGDAIPVEPFRLSTETENAPSFFEIVFMLEGVKYRYGFEVDNEKVCSEWLFYTPKTKEVELFSRENGEISYSTAFKEGKGIDERTRPNALFLSVVAQFNGEVSIHIINWLTDSHIVLSGFSDNELRRQVEFLLQMGLGRETLLRFIKIADLGIDGIKLIKLPVTEHHAIRNLTGETKKMALQNLDRLSLASMLPSKEINEIKTVHRKFDNNGQSTSEVLFNLDTDESDGSRKIAALSIEFASALQTNSTLIVDELDARLHPLITQTIIRLFNSPQNAKGAQLIFTTHDTNLLSNKNFRRDQIWFTEKDKYGATDLYSLAEYKVRNDASYEKDYIAGKYGAIPFIGSLDLGESGADG